MSIDAAGELSLCSLAQGRILHRAYISGSGSLLNRDIFNAMATITAPSPSALNQARLDLLLAARPAECEDFLRELADCIGHDLRSLLQTITGFAELLSMEIDGPLTERQQKHVSYIQKDAGRLLAIVNQIAALMKAL
jgi:signal transduction histidine kinase